MDYKEKYEHGLECIQEILCGAGDSIKTSILRKRLQPFFPELEESDENVREDIISLVNEFWDRIGSINPEYSSRGRMIAWLEKQKAIDVLDAEEREFADNVNSYRKDMDEFYKKGYDAGREAEKQYWLGKQDEPNPYSGTSFEYDGHIWDMHARDNGVEIIFDGERKAFLSLEKSFIFPIYPQPSIIPKSAQETINGVKVEPKFKVGDWVVDNCGYVWKIKGIKNQFYLLEGVEGDESLPTIECVNKTFHLWTIEDSKDGDVIVCNINKAEIGGDVEKLPNMTSTICIYQNVVKDSDYIHSYCSLYDENSLVLQNKMYYNTFVYNIYPATKEQHELLFQTMKEYGYEWDSEKKELKKIEITSKESEDERIRKELIEHIKANKEADYVLFKKFSPDDVIAWLEKQGQRLDADKVIDWLKTKVYDDSTFGMAMIDQFKEDFGL